jgi:hypothetical protein
VLQNLAADDRVRTSEQLRRAIGIEVTLHELGGRKSLSRQSKSCRLHIDPRQFRFGICLPNPRKQRTASAPKVDHDRIPGQAAKLIDH